VYGLNNICTDIEFMLGMKISWYWKFCWGFFVPLVLIVILAYSLAVSESLKYNGQDYPDSAIGML
jgi:solute carrier family 6 amino acid transporter-like protein 5/7/9/14